MITLIEDLQEGIKSPPLFYVEESEIAYKGETREFGQRVLRTFTALSNRKAFCNTDMIKVRVSPFHHHGMEGGTLFSDKARWL